MKVVILKTSFPWWLNGLHWLNGQRKSFTLRFQISCRQWNAWHASSDGFLRLPQKPSPCSTPVFCPNTLAVCLYQFPRQFSEMLFFSKTLKYVIETYIIFPWMTALQGRSYLLLSISYSSDVIREKKCATIFLKERSLERK